MHLNWVVINWLMLSMVFKIGKLELNAMIIVFVFNLLFLLNSMMGMVIERILVPDMALTHGTVPRKIVTIGITKILCESPKMLNEYRKFWPTILQNVIHIFELPADVANEPDQYEKADNEGYEAAFSQLSFALPKVRDPCSKVTDCRQYLAESLGKLANQFATGNIASLISIMPAEHLQAVQKYCAQAGVQIV